VLDFLLRLDPEIYFFYGVSRVDFFLLHTCTRQTKHSRRGALGTNVKFGHVTLPWFHFCFVGFACLILLVDLLFVPFVLILLIALGLAPLTLLFFCLVSFMAPARPGQSDARRICLGRLLSRSDASLLSRGGILFLSRAFGMHWCCSMVLVWCKVWMSRLQPPIIVS